MGQHDGWQRIGRRALLAGAAAASMARPAFAAGNLAVGTWPGDYADLLAKTIDKPLAKSLGVTINQDLDLQDTRKAKLIAERTAAHGTLDVACLSDMDAYAMAQLGLLEPITATNVPNSAHVLPALRTAYAVPHIYTALVIVYNPTLVKPAPTSYSDFWDPKFRNRIGFSDGLALYNIAAAALSHGGAMNNFDPGRAALRDLKRLGAKTYPTNDAMMQALRGEEIWLAPAWLARAAFWRRSGLSVAVVVPEEGSTPYVSLAMVPKNAPNMADAMSYLNALLDPHAQAAFADRMSYAPTVDNASVSADLMKSIGFTPEQQAQFKPLDYEYLAKAAAQLVEYWNREFRS